MTDRTSRVALMWLAMSAGLLVATGLALGFPDVGLAGNLLSGAYPSVASAVAFASLLCYLAVLLALLLGVAEVARGGSVWLLSFRPGLALAFLLTGAILLGLSLAGRVGGGGQLCCGGSAAQVHEAVSLVH